MKKKRIIWVDLLKAFGIILVMMGHIYQKNDVFYQWIYSFHVPLFFFLSGLFFINGDSFKVFINKRWKTLILPYIFFYLITYIYWILVERELRTSVGGVSAEWWRPLGGAIIGIHNYNLMPHNNPLWFIPALFFIECLANTCKSISIPLKLFVSLILFILFVLCLHFGIVLPFEGIIALECFGFYLLGYLFITIVGNKDKLFFLLLCVILYIALLILYNGYAKSYTIITPNIEEMPQYILFALCSVIFLYCIASYIPTKKSPFYRAIAFIGKNSLVILCIHDPVKRAFIYVYSKLFHLSIEQIRTDLYHSFIILTILTISLIPIIWGYNKCIKPLFNRI